MDNTDFSIIAILIVVVKSVIFLPLPQHSSPISILPLCTAALTVDINGLKICNYKIYELRFDNETAWLL